LRSGARHRSHTAAPRDGDGRTRVCPRGGSIMTHTGTGKYERMLERCGGAEPIPTAVAYPCEETALAGAIDAARAGMIIPILVGPATTIAVIAKARGIDLGGVEVLDVADSHAAAAKAVELV